MMRILHVVSVMDVGGMESFIMNLYRRMDREQIQFDFLVHHGRRGVFEDEIEALGGRVYHTTLMDDGNLPGYCLSLRRLFREHPEYRIVHGHLGSTALWYLGAAKRQGVPWRILHSHCPGRIHTLKGSMKHVLFQFSPRHANIHLACSEEAGRYQFRDDSFEVIPNGIDVRRFLFDSELRSGTRARLGLEDRFVVGHVGRFYHEKNHAYLLRSFRAFHAQAPNSMLMLVGDGALKERMEDLARELDLRDSVLFMGLQKDTAPLYQAMDMFVLPSVYEGLPLTGIEAQCAGLPCVFSDNMSANVKLNENTAFLPVGEDDIARWVDAMLKIREKKKREAPSSAIWLYDAALAAQRMAERYKTLWEKSE